MAHWGIVGGGLLGMTLALRLRQRGEQVTLLEAGSSLGGLATAWSIGDVVWDRHYHVILLSDRHTRAMLEELGLENKTCWTETGTGFYTDGKLYSMSNAIEYLRFPPLGLIEKLRLAATILYASRIRDWKPLERILVGDWLCRFSGRGVYKKIWLPLLRAKLGDCYKKTSAAFIWATINRMYAARRTGLKKEMFGYVKGGYARILEKFSQQLRSSGVAIRLESPVQHIHQDSESAEHVLSVGDETLSFDRVVLTTPASVAARTCPQLSAGELEKLQGIEYVGIVCASVLLKRPLSSYYITNITDPAPFTAVIEMSALVDRIQFNGNALVYLPKYATADEPIFSRSDEEIQEEFLAALRRMYPHMAEDDVLAFRISRVPNVFALPTLRYSEKLPPIKTSVPGLHIVNSAHIVNGTLNVNETIALAERLVPELLNA